MTDNRLAPAILSTIGLLVPGAAAIFLRPTPRHAPITPATTKPVPQPGT